MILFTLLSHVAPERLIGFFSSEPGVIAFGGEYLRIISLNFLAMGLIFTSSSMFQAMGNTVPSLIASAARIVIIVIPATILASAPGFQLRWIWFLSMGAVYVQLTLSLLLLRREYARRLQFDAVSV